MYKGSSLDITVGPNKPQSSYGNGTNSANKYSNGNLNVNADMKDTGIPIYMILIVLISSIGCIFRIRK